MGGWKFIRRCIMMSRPIDGLKTFRLLPVGAQPEKLTLEEADESYSAEYIVFLQTPFRKKRSFLCSQFAIGV